MPYYKDTSGRTHFLDDASHAYLLPAGCVAITDAEGHALEVPGPVPLKVQAAAALDKSDATMLRCVEAGILAPAAWNTYRKALRAIANGTDTVSAALPVMPAYPAGT